MKNPCKDIKIKTCHIRVMHDQRTLCGISGQRHTYYTVGPDMLRHLIEAKQNKDTIQFDSNCCKTCARILDANT
jgi:hypothetical protein